MQSRRLTTDELVRCHKLLANVRVQLLKLSDDDKELLFAYRRKVIVKLTHDERGTPAQRNKLKALKREQQKGLCAICSKKLPLKYVELDRRKASDGYTKKNTRLVHHLCHTADQRKKAWR